MIVWENSAFSVVHGGDELCSMDKAIQDTFIGLSINGHHSYAWNNCDETGYRKTSTGASKADKQLYI